MSQKNIDNEIEIVLGDLRHAHATIKTREINKPVLDWMGKQQEIQTDTLLLKIKEAIHYAELVKKHFF